MTLTKARFQLKAAIMAITAVQSNESMDDGLPPAATDVPAWLLNRRERQSSGDGSSMDQSAEPSISLTFPPPLPRAKPKSKTPVVDVTGSDVKSDPPNGTWLTRWISRQGLIGVAVSLFVHTTVLGALAFILMSNVSTREGMQILGLTSESDEVGDNLLLDTTMTLDAGESAPLQMTDVGQALEGIGPGNDLAESMRVGTGGKGKGDGDGDGGVSGGGLTLNVPGHAQTKGSFSAWTEPRDPKPLQHYFVVIQIRLPRAVKKYRGTDLTGRVTGTDTFRHEIRYKATETFPVENGTVEVRIFIPGGDRLVRDTIHVESKLLREKQTFEIEF